MPTLWRYLLRNYFQVFFLCVSSFIAVLLVTRFQEIAKFAALAPHKTSVLYFILYQIPYILPIAIPISCLIATLILIQKMSSTHELTSLRACGLPLKSIFYPLFLASAFIGMINLHVTSELLPDCRGRSKNLIYEMTTVNPLFLLQKDTLIKIKHTFVDMKSMNAGENAKDVIFVINNQSNGRLSMMVAEKLSLEEGLLLGKNVALISSIDSKDPENFDHIIIENQKLMTTQDSTLSNFIQGTSQQIGFEQLPLRLMLSKYKTEKDSKLSTGPRLRTEIARRISFGLAPLTFTFIGSAFGMSIGRNQNKKRLIWAILLSSACLLSFVIGKSLKQMPFIAFLFYVLPHPCIIAFSLKSLFEISRGKE
jgi:lipopolysaccharide export system permease protein